MQISAANLLLAAQQAKPAASPRAQGTAFADAMVGAKPAAKPFALPDFDSAQETADAPRKEPAKAPETRATPAPIARGNGYAAVAAPGSSLNICV